MGSQNPPPGKPDKPPRGLLGWLQNPGATMRAAIVTGIFGLMAVIITYLLTLIPSRPQSVIVLYPTDTPTPVGTTQPPESPSDLSATATPRSANADEIPTPTATAPAATPFSIAPTSPMFSPTLPPAVDGISIRQQFEAPGDSATGITWDGQSLWVSDNSARVFLLDTSGKVLAAPMSPEASPGGLAWDGATLWLFTGNYGDIYQLSYLDQKLVEISSFRSPGDIFGGGITQDLAWDGTSLWYANQFNLFELSTTGEVLQTLAFPKNITGVDWDGRHLWLSSGGFAEEAEFRVVDRSGNLLARFDSPVPDIVGIAWGGSSLWVLSNDVFGFGITLYELDVSAALQSIP